MHGSDAEAIHSTNGLNGVTSAAQLDMGFAQRRISVIDGAQVDSIALPTSIVKRDGRIVFFDPMRIERALSRCFAARVVRCIPRRGRALLTRDGSAVEGAAGGF